MPPELSVHLSSPTYWVERFVCSLADADRRIFPQESALREMPETPEFAGAMHGFCSFSPKENTYFIRSSNFTTMVERNRTRANKLLPRALECFVDGCAFRTARSKAYYVFGKHIRLRNYTETMQDQTVLPEMKHTLEKSAHIRDLHRIISRAQMRRREISLEYFVELDLSITHLLTHVALLEGRDMEYLVNIIRT